jgi:transcriptional repressor NF-X1
MITLTCPCGRISHPAQCSRSTTNHSISSSKQIKCSGDCAIARRNAKLADALGITSDARDKSNGVSFGEAVLGFARQSANAKFVALVEKTFAK